MTRSTGRAAVPSPLTVRWAAVHDGSQLTDRFPSPVLAASDLETLSWPSEHYLVDATER